MKTFFLFLPLFLCHHLHSQKLIQNKHEKGYVKDGNKYSIWEYYDSDGNLELKINHNNGKILYIKKDSSDFVIFKNGEWQNQKLKVYPIPETGWINFYSYLGQNLNYPKEARISGYEGLVMVMFEIDTSGIALNFNIVENLKGGCGEEVVRVLKENPMRWIPALLDGVFIPARLILPVQFIIGYESNKKKKTEIPQAKILPEMVLRAIAVKR